MRFDIEFDINVRSEFHHMVTFHTETCPGSCASWLLEGQLCWIPDTVQSCRKHWGVPLVEGVALLLFHLNFGISQIQRRDRLPYIVGFLLSPVSRIARLLYTLLHCSNLIVISKDAEILEAGLIFYLRVEFFIGSTCLPYVGVDSTKGPVIGLTWTYSLIYHNQDFNSQFRDWKLPVCPADPQITLYEYSSSNVWQLCSKSGMKGSAIKYEKSMPTFDIRPCPLICLLKSENSSRWVSSYERMQYLFLSSKYLPVPKNWLWVLEFTVSVPNRGIQ